MQPRSQFLLEQAFAKQLVLRAFQSTHRAAYATVATPSDAVKSPLRRRKGGDLGAHLPKHVIPSDVLIPPYPHGNHTLYKQANRGLYGNQMVQFGNNVSERTKTKTRRDWKPNVLSKSLYSITLKKKIKLRITGRVLKTMDREGGLDEYLLKDSEYRLKELGPLGWALRWTLLQQPGVIARMRAEAAALGVDQAAIDQQWPTPNMLAAQNASRNDFVRASDLVGDEMEEDVQDVEEISPEQTSFRASRDEAIREYKAAVRAAKRYVASGAVGNLQDALKVAFLRQPQRTEQHQRIKAAWSAKLAELFTADECKRIQAEHKLEPSMSDEEIRRFAIYKYLDKKAPEFASIHDFKAAVVAKTYPVEHQTPEDIAAAKAQQKEANVNLLAEAENVSNDPSVDPERRAFIERALQKAQWADTARGEAPHSTQYYADMVIGEPYKTNDLSEPSTTGNVDEGADWEDIAKSKNTTTEQQPRV